MVVCNLLLQADCEGPYPHLLHRLLRHTDIRSPDVIRADDIQRTQQIGINRMLRMPLAVVRLAVQRMKFHQGGDTAATNGQTFTLENPAQHSCSVEREFQVKFVNPTLQRQILG